MSDRKYEYLDIDQRCWGGLETLFPGWKGAEEVVCVYSPHDDDAILGAGYAMRAVVDAGAQVHVFIACDGACGYSTIEEREGIVERRQRETIACYAELGIPEENILFLGFPDFSAIQYIGRILEPSGREGQFKQTIAEMRKRGVTRTLVPNHYREHIDHWATFMMGSYDTPQVGDPVAVDWGKPQMIRSTAQYSVWAELDPEDAVLKDRADKGLRADVVIAASPAVEDCMMTGLRRYASQEAIISDLVEQRKARLLGDGRFIEVYRRFDPRPKLNFAPYRKLIEGLAGK